MPKTEARSGRKAGKRGNSLPWAKMGHNGLHPESTLNSVAARRGESGSEPKPLVVKL